jgi:hypothetical protein
MIFFKLTKYLIAYIAIFTSLAAAAQLPKIQLNTQPYNPVPFTPNQYTAPTSDVSKLEQSLKKENNEPTVRQKRQVN